MPKFDHAVWCRARYAEARSRDPMPREPGEPVNANRLRTDRLSRASELRALRKMIRGPLADGKEWLLRLCPAPSPVGNGYHYLRWRPEQVTLNADGVRMAHA